MKRRNDKILILRAVVEVFGFNYCVFDDSIGFNTNFGNISITKSEKVCFNALEKCLRVKSFNFMIFV